MKIQQITSWFKFFVVVVFKWWIKFWKKKHPKEHRLRWKKGFHWSSTVFTYWSTLSRSPSSLLSLYKHVSISQICLEGYHLDMTTEMMHMLCNLRTEADDILSSVDCPWLKLLLFTCLVNLLVLIMLLKHRNFTLLVSNISGLLSSMAVILMLMMAADSMMKMKTNVCDQFSLLAFSHHQ